jgi:hypothetical protein
MTKSCSTCFFKNFGRQDAPCKSCDHTFSKYVTDSDTFWKDKPMKEPDCTENSPDLRALDRQVAGDHYKKLKIQPVEYCHANKLGCCESNIIKYITRWKDKGGKADLEKVKHYVDLLIQLEGL